MAEISWIQVAIGFVSGVVSSAIAGVLVYHLYFKGRFKATDKPAIEKLAKRLGEMIREAKYGRDVLVAARATIALRNQSKNALMGLMGAFNSDMDRLEEEVSHLDQNPYNSQLEFKVRNTLKVLEGKWPQIEQRTNTEIKKLLVELGIEEA